jgi:hypothetical protein
VKIFVGFGVVLMSAGVMAAQASAGAKQQAPPPKGTVLFQSHGTAPETPDDGEQQPAVVPNEKPGGVVLTDAERGSIGVVGYDLDARITPATAKLAMRARVTVRNDGAVALHRVALQISSTLRWESATLLSANGPKLLTFSQHLLETDADHTGKANEAVIALPVALEPGKTVELDTFYDGTIEASGQRLEQIGASAAQASASDWDAIGASGTYLRGFGNVLWYPVASPQLFLGDGAKLFNAIGETKLRDEAAMVRLRLAVEYKGDPPAEVYFCGRRKAFMAVPDNSEAPIAMATGVATAEFAAEPLGFRVLNLFVVNEAEQLVAPTPVASDVDMAPPDGSKVASPAVPDLGADVSSSNVGGASVGMPMLAVVSDDAGAVKALAASAETVAPLLQQWMGAEPLSALTVIDHNGEPFEDGPLLVGPAAALGTSAASGGLAHSLTHAWVQTGRPWMDDGLAEFMSLMWVEQERGRDAAIAQLDDMELPLAAIEPEIQPGKAPQGLKPLAPASANGTHSTSLRAGSEAVPLQERSDATVALGQPLITASSDVYYRGKAAAVWWMLREIVGEDALTDALRAWRVEAPVKRTAAEDALAFEKLLERSGKANAAHPIDLKWFFNDWVLHDRGLPDLSIVNVVPRQLPMGAKHTVGYLIAVTVKNDGAAEAEVPVTLRSDVFSRTSELRIAGFGSATLRVVLESMPTEVLVNDGVTPEVRTSFHRVNLVGVKVSSE